MEKEICYPIRILHVLNGLECGGAETLVMNLFRNIDRTKVMFDFVVHTAKEGFYEKEALNLGARIFRLPAYKIYNHIGYCKAWKNLLSQHPEWRTVHGHVYSIASVYLKIAKEKGRTTICHCHGVSNGNGLKGKIKDLSSTPVIEKLHISTPTALTLNIPQTKDGTLNLTANITAAGKIDKLSADGNISAADISIPSMYVSAQNAQIILNNNIITVKTDDLRIKDTNLAIEASAKPDILTSNKIDYLKLTASYIDMDYLTGLLSLFNPSKYAPGNDFPYIISSGNLDIKSFKMGVIKAQNITAKITSQKNNLYISDLFADAYGGKAAAKIVYNFPYTNIKADVQARGLNAASAAAAFMPADKGISGTLDFDASVNMMGTTPQQQLNTMKGSADVLIKNGRLGQLGRFEHFLYAQNLLSQKLIYASLNSAKQAISPQDTGMISYLKAKVKFGAGYAHLNPVLTSGPRMSMYIKGKINLVTQDVDLKILGKISSDVSGSLGLLGSMTIKDFLDEHTKYGPVIANLFDSYNTELPETDISTIPALSPAGSAQTKNFQVIISGDPDSVKAVKSFTWVNPTGTKEKILTQKVKKAISEALPSKTSQDTQPVLPKPQPQIQTAPQTAVPDFLDKIPDEFKKSEKNL